MMEDNVYFSIDNESLKSFDDFASECSRFINNFRDTRLSTDLSRETGRSATKAIVFWSSGRTAHDQKAAISLLQAREERVENELRRMVDDAMTNISSLGAQADHLMHRLHSCIAFNKSESDLLGDQLAQIQMISTELSFSDKATREALHFVNEVIAQRDELLERRMVLSSYGYFAETVEADPSERDGSHETCGFTVRDRTKVIQRLNEIREVRLLI
jgi:hypothetical protein